MLKIRNASLVLPIVALFSSYSLDVGGAPTDNPSFGYIETPVSYNLSNTKVPISGWILDTAGIEKVFARIDGKVEIEIQYGLSRKDVAAVFPHIQDGEHSGFSLEQDLAPYLAGNSVIEIVAVDKQGNSSVIGRRHLVSTAGKDKWQALYERYPDWQQDPFYVLHGTSGLSRGGAQGVAESYADHRSPTMRIGLRVPILYMRTTKGKGTDWEFNPEFDLSTEHKGKRLADDSLQNVIEFSKKEQLPILFTLNGGVWADAFGTAPDWDLNDHLEEDVNNCQWSQRNEVFPDDYLRGLSGSTESPELARVLTLNTYAEDARHYKKRNLQAAGRFLVKFNSDYPQLFAGINLDADVYANPFFDDRWHDYNPQTIRQFREWIEGSGLYASGGLLEEYRRPDTLSLNEVRTLSGRDYQSWQDVDAPRDIPAKGRPISDSQHKSLEEIAAEELPWIREWELFRRHLVDLHYDELSKWLTESGIGSRDIYSSQGFSAPHSRALPFATYLDSPVKNYDSGGMSIEGSVPRYGHLGTIIYGESAVNNIRMETNTSLFRAFFDADPDWGVVEYNTSDFKTPDQLADYASAYRSLRDLFNYQARFVSPMAWNGSSGDLLGRPGFASHTALRDTPLELAIKDFMVAHAYLPRSAILWDFGSARHSDYDRWTAAVGQLIAQNGVLLAKPEQGRIELIAPNGEPLDADRHRTLILGIESLKHNKKVTVEARTRTGGKSLTGRLRLADLPSTDAGVEIELQWPKDSVNQGMVISLSGINVPLQISHIAFLPIPNSK